MTQILVVVENGVDVEVCDTLYLRSIAEVTVDAVGRGERVKRLSRTAVSDSVAWRALPSVRRISSGHLQKTVFSFFGLR